MNEKKCIDADALELEYRRMKDDESLGGHNGAMYITGCLKHCCSPRKHSQRAGRNGSEQQRESPPQRTQTRTAAS